MVKTSTVYLILVGSVCMHIHTYVCTCACTVPSCRIFHGSPEGADLGPGASSASVAHVNTPYGRLSVHVAYRKSIDILQRCVRVCVHAYVCACMRECVHACKCVCLSVRACVHLHSTFVHFCRLSLCVLVQCMYVYSVPMLVVRVFVCTELHTIFTYLLTFERMYIHMYVRTYVCMYVPTVHTYIHM